MKKIIILIVTFFSILTHSQNFDFGKISVEELEEKFNPSDSSANASYLYKYRKTFFEYSKGAGFELITEIQERIKIYNQEGFNYATTAVRLAKNGSNKEEFSGLKAYTYNLIDGKIKEDKIEKQGIFESELHRYAEEVKFTMPNIKAGCVIEFKYKIRSPFITNVDEFVLQHNIPIKKLEAEFEAPEYFNFRVNTKGYLTVVPKTEKKNDQIIFNYTPTAVRDQNSPITTYASSETNFIKNSTKYSLLNIPALIEEPYVNSIDNYRSTVKYELSFIKFPNSPIKYYSTTWEDVVKTIYKSSNFGDELNKSGYFENDIDALISSTSNLTDRTSIIFDFVKSKVKWNGYYGYYTNDGVKKAYKDQVGNVAEINLMLTSMLRYAGIDAFPVLVSTRQNGIPLFPTIEGYNYVVTYVKDPDGVILLDATNKNSLPNVLPLRVLNWQGRVISEHGGSELIDLYPATESKNNILGIVSLDDQGTLKGALKSIKTNHNALLYREAYNEVSKDDFLEQIENKHKGLEISDFEVTNITDLSEPIIESYKLEKESQADIINNKIYFSPLFFLRTGENPFKLDKREYPVDFGFPSKTTYRIRIDIPEGYKIESLPKAEVFVLPDNLGTYKYNIMGHENSVQLSISAEINEPIITAGNYEILKLYFNKLVEKEAEQIVLTKI